MSDREKRGFLKEDPEEQFERAREELYSRADSAQTLEESLYFWAAVYSGRGSGEQWGGKNPAANAVREMLTKRYVNPYYLDNARLDDVAYTPDLGIVQETIRQKKKEGKDHWYAAIENTNPQLHELSLDMIFTMKSLILEVLSVCSYSEKRLFAFILVENGLHAFIELFEDRTVLGDFTDILEELYMRIREEEGKREKRDQRAHTIVRVGKRKFVSQGRSKSVYTKIVESFEKKVHPLFFPLLEEKGSYEIQNKVLECREDSEDNIGRSS